MQINKHSFITKTLAGDYISIRSSIQFAQADAQKCTNATGKKCVIFKVLVEEIIEVE